MNDHVLNFETDLLLPFQCGASDVLTFPFLILFWRRCSLVLSLYVLNPSLPFVFQCIGKAVFLDYDLSPVLCVSLLTSCSKYNPNSTATNQGAALASHTSVLWTVTIEMNTEDPQQKTPFPAPPYCSFCLHVALT